MTMININAKIIINLGLSIILATQPKKKSAHKINAKNSAVIIGSPSYTIMQKAVYSNMKEKIANTVATPANIHAKTKLLSIIFISTF